MTRSLLILFIVCAVVVITGITVLAKRALAQAPETQAPAQPAVAAGPLDNTVYMDLKNNCRVTIELAPEKAPSTVARIKELVQQGFYNGVVFHRVIAGFMVQGGDPTGTGMGGSGKKLPDEFPLGQGQYTRGTLAMANAGPGTSDSQFFIMLADYPLPPQYTIFGRVTKGMECVDDIKKGDSADNGKVTSPDKIVKMTMAADAK